MDTVLGGGYSLDDLRRATDAYVLKRTKIWRGAVWYKPDTSLPFEYGDETLYQVGEIFSCSKKEAEEVLLLLKVSGAHFVFATYTHEEPEDWDDDDDDEEEDYDFDEGNPSAENWMAKFGGGRKNPTPWGVDVVGKSYRMLGLLSGKGLRRQKQTMFRDGRSGEPIFSQVKKCRSWRIMPKQWRSNTKERRSTKYEFC